MISSSLSPFSSMLSAVSTETTPRLSATSPVGRPDGRVQRQERRLQRRQLHQHLQRARVRRPARRHLLPAAGQPRERRRAATGGGGGCDVVGQVALEAREADAGDVVLVRAHAEPGGARRDGLLHDVAERRAGHVERLGEGERGGAHGVAHGVLGGHDALQDGAELHRERVRLLLEQRVAPGGAGQPRLHHAQRRHRRHHVQALLPLPRHRSLAPHAAAPHLRSPSPKPKTIERCSWSSPSCVHAALGEQQCMIGSAGMDAWCHDGSGETESDGNICAVDALRLQILVVVLYLCIPELATTYISSTSNETN